MAKQQPTSGWDWIAMEFDSVFPLALQSLAAARS